jgi:Holliday junction resolvase RusA-like endonuclease
MRRLTPQEITQENTLFELDLDPPMARLRLRLVLNFEALGRVVGQGQISFLGKGRPAVHTNRKILDPWRATVRRAAVEAIIAQAGPLWEPIDGPVCVDRFYTLPRPAAKTSQRPHPTVKSATCGDIDHYDRAVLDALKGTVYLDDVQVLGGLNWKAYPGGHPQCPPQPGVYLRIYRVE